MNTAADDKEMNHPTPYSKDSIDTGYAFQIKGKNSFSFDGNVKLEHCDEVAAFDETFTE